jgi:hypothetical protein
MVERERMHRKKLEKYAGRHTKIVRKIQICTDRGRGQEKQRSRKS